MGVSTVINAAVAAAVSPALPWGKTPAGTSTKNSSSRSSGYDGQADESHRPLLRLDTDTSDSRNTRTYGTTASSHDHGRIHSSPERIRDSPLLNRVPEETEPGVDFGEGYTEREPLHPGDDDEDADAEWEWELEQQGFYRGSYRRLVALYSLVPLFSILVFALLVLLPILIFPSPGSASSSFPIYDLLASVSLWSLSHVLRVPSYSFSLAVSSALLPASATTTISNLLSTFLHVVLTICLRLASLPLRSISLNSPRPSPRWHDPAFHRVWWLALGWSAAEVAVGIAQGYEQTALYRDVLVNSDAGDAEEEFHLTPGVRSKSGSAPASAEPSSRGLSRENGSGEPYDIQAGQWIGSSTTAEARGQLRREDAIRSEVDRDLDSLMALKGREEVEEVFGMPFIRIPVFVSCLLRLDSILLSLGLTLLLSSAYLRSSFAPALHRPFSQTNTPLKLILPFVFLLHFFLSVLHSPLLLPRIGVHTAAYVGLVASLGCLFAGLGVWEALS